MDAVRRHETPGSEKKDFVMRDTRTAIAGFSEVIKRGPKHT